MLTVYSSKNPPIVIIKAITPAANNSPIIVEDIMAIETSKSDFMSFSCISASIASLIIGSPHNMIVIHDKSKNNKFGFINPIISVIAEINISVISINSSFLNQFLIFIKSP